jgi:hypothetical protein
MQKTLTSNTSTIPNLTPPGEPLHFEIPMDGLEPAGDATDPETTGIDAQIALESGSDLVCEAAESPFGGEAFSPAPAKARPGVGYFAGPSIDAVLTRGALMHYGHRGEDAKEVQQWLNLANAGRSSIAEDGLFGPKTRAAVEAFQRSTGLDVTGVVDRRTLEALKEAGAGGIRRQLSLDV